MAGRWRTRIGVFGDLPTRVALHSLGLLPWFLEPALIGGWTLIFFLVAKSQRRAVTENLRAMHPGWGHLRGLFGAWRVFWNFALTYADAKRCQSATGAVDWAVEGIDHLENLSRRKEGCIILTAHMGNYDLAAPVFAARFQRTLYTVRAPEREPETHRLREQEIRRLNAANPHFRTLYNLQDNLLGIELARLLAEGNIVAVQGDRVVHDISPMAVEVEPGLTMRLPKGPLFLARATDAPCFPLFIVRDGWRRYRVIALPEVELPPRVRGAEDEAAKVWAANIYPMLRRHWPQWYVFEPLLTRRAG